MSMKLLSGSTTNGTMDTVAISIQNWIFARVGSIWVNLKLAPVLGRDFDRFFDLEVR